MDVSTKEWFTVLSTIQSLKVDLVVQETLLENLIGQLSGSGALSEQQITRLVDYSKKCLASIEEDEPAAEHPVGSRLVDITETGVVAGPIPVFKGILPVRFSALLDRAYFEMCAEQGGNSDLW